MGDFMMGIKGLVHSPFEVTSEDFDLPWIARSLSRQGRYLGNGNHFLSVAEHSVECSHLVPEEHAFTALMHDAPEAFVGDMHGYIKKLMHDQGERVFDTLENFFWMVLSEKYNLPLKLPAVVHDVDINIRELEMQSLFGERRILAALEPMYAEDAFLDRAEELRPDLYLDSMWY